MLLIGKYDHDKAKNIVSLVNTQKLSAMAKDVWDKPYDIVHLCSALAVGSNRIAKQFIEHNLDKINVMFSPLVAMAPQCAVTLFKGGIRIDLLTEHWWDYGYHALKALIKVDSRITSQILFQNIPVIAERINDIHAHYMEDRYCLAFVQLVCDFDSAVFDQLLGMLDEKKISDSWNKSFSDPYKKKSIKSRYEKLVDLLHIQTAQPLQ